MDERTGQTSSRVTAPPKSLEAPPLYGIVNVPTQPEPLEFCKRLLGARVLWIQIRAKGFPADAYLQLVRECLSARDSLNPDAKILVNDFPELCKEAGADGVHVGQGDADPEDARRLLGPNSIIGLSSHSPAQANAAQAKAGPLAVLTYLALGPIFASTTKSGHADVVGLATLAEVCAGVRIPIVAIGGISAANAAEVYAAGASSVAVIAELEQSRDLTATVAQFNAAYAAAAPKNYLPAKA